MNVLHRIREITIITVAIAINIVLINEYFWLFAVNIVLCKIMDFRVFRIGKLILNNLNLYVFSLKFLYQDFLQYPLTQLLEDSLNLFSSKVAISNMMTKSIHKIKIVDESLIVLDHKNFMHYPTNAIIFEP